MNKKKQIEELKAQIAYHNRLYYEESLPKITDDEYDILVKKLRNLMEEGYQTDLFTLGVTETKFQKIKHLSPMLSLGNVFDRHELDDFVKRINNFLNTEAVQYEFTAEKKIDGISFSAIYKERKLVYVLTRGDGEMGENITENVLTIENFPKEILIDGTAEIRGEIYMLSKDFEMLNDMSKKNGDKIFANPRNAASGSIRQLDASITRSRKLRYFVYSMICNDIHLQTQDELYKVLSENGFVVNQYILCQNIDEMLAYYNDVARRRFELGFDIDGIVYKLNSIPLQKRLGMTANAPRWAIAHKFSAQSGETKIIEITMQVGRTGIITPVAILMPINIGGVVVRRATLHNKDEILRLGINIGDIVAIERAGDVIPKITSVIKKEGKDVFVFPSICPCCGGVLIQVDALVRCTNFNKCREQILGRLKYFVSKDCFNIVGFGEKQIEEFYDRGIICNYADIFAIPENVDKIGIASWESWGSISVNNLINAINKSKNITLARFISSLGIYTIGVENAKILATFFKTASNLLMNVNEEDLVSLDGIGQKTAREVVLYLKNNKTDIASLLSIVDIMDNIEQKLHRGTILFTGTLSISRQEAKELAHHAGFAVVSTVSKNLDYLVAGTDAGSNLKKAKDLDIKILTEQDFIQLYNL